ncbi:DNA methyltransferase [Rosistilla oblonga]|uniref:DNA methyltransferase n=1 Tax=Rosistilla oblonga TaxID=2527990 RepID=UPI003A9825A4
MARKRTPTLHPACKLFPLLGENELQELAEDIKANGLQNAIILHDGKVLDGQNRLAACKLAGVEPRFVEWKGSGSPLHWVVSQNLMRRHLSASQRAVLALDLLPMLEREAKERQRKSSGRGKKVAKECATFNGKASEAAARIVKSNTRYVETVKEISATAPELLDKIRAGAVGVPSAIKVSKMILSDRQRLFELANGSPLTSKKLTELTKKVRNEARSSAAEAFSRTARFGKGQDIVSGDMSLLWKRLADNSVDLFLCDPVYDQTELYDRLAELAAAKLKPGGLCLAYTGHMRLPVNIEAMARHLEYWWIFAIQHEGNHSAIYARHLQNCWKAVLAFAKPPIKPATAWLKDSLSGGGRDKEFHEWGQHESEAAYLVQRLTSPGELVVDPFCGGGTVPAACKATGRRWLATEINATTAKIARKRLSEMEVK